MNQELLAQKFRAIGARVRLDSEDHQPFWRRETTFSIDVARDSKGELFEILVTRDDVDVRVLDCRPRDRHLLLLVDDERFLCGHDERHWFVASVHRGSTVWEAKDSLKPPAVRDAENRAQLRTRDRNRRRNAAFQRQGEWFFIPLP